MRKVTTGMAMVVLALSAGAAQAQTARNWYVAGAVTGSYLDDPKSAISNAPTPGTTLLITNKVKSGWGGQLALGRQLQHFRLEAELGYTENDANRYIVTSPINASIPQDGSDAITRYMANGYFDIPIGALPVTPYVGLGVGLANVHVKTVAGRPFGPPSPPTKLIDDTIDTAAYQVMAGAAFKISERVKLTAQYRWFDAGKIKGHDSRGQTLKTDISGSNIDVGLRVSF